MASVQLQDDERGCGQRVWTLARNEENLAALAALLREIPSSAAASTDPQAANDDGNGNGNGDVEEERKKKKKPPVAEVVDAYVGEDGTTALQAAAARGNAAVVRLLLDCGADPNRPSPSDIYTSYTALHYACTRVEETHVECVRVLLSDPRTDVNARNAKGQTPLSVACTQGSPALVRILLADPRVDKDTKDDDGIRPLMLVAATGRDHFLDVLLGNPQITKSINATDKNGDTALHHAFQIQLQRVFKNAYPVTPVQEALVYRLVRAGADLLIKNKDKIPPSYYASRRFKTVLHTVSELVRTGVTQLPESLEGLLETSNESIRGLAGGSDEEKEDLILAISQYKAERDAALEQQAKMGGCPFVALQPRDEPPADSDEEEDEDESDSDSDDDDEDEEDSSAEEEQAKKEKKAKKAPAPAPVTAAAAVSAAAGLPSAHPGVAPGADISACPFFNKLKAASAAASSAPTSTTPSTMPSAATPSSHKATSTVPTASAQPSLQGAAVPKGKCPIPFHNELVDRRNWIFLAILIVAVVIARLV